MYALSRLYLLFNYSETRVLTENFILMICVLHKSKMLNENLRARTKSINKEVLSVGVIKIPDINFLVLHIVFRKTAKK